MKKILLFILIIIPLVFAQTETLGTFKYNTNINIIQLCQNSTYSNISAITYTPNSTQIINNETIMSKNGVRYNYTFTDTGSIGNYKVDGHCDINGIDTTWAYDFNINLTGNETNNSTGMIYLILFVGLVIILGLTTWGAIVFPWKNHRNDEGLVVGINDLKYVKVILWIFVYLEVFFIVTILKNISGEYLIGFYNFFNIAFWFMLVCMIPFFPLLIFYTVVIWLSDKKTLKAIQRGFSVK